MVQSIFPYRKSNRSESSKAKQQLGLELALPLTILAFIALAEVSPLLKMHTERIVEWLCDNDYVVKATTLFILVIPAWMIYKIWREAKQQVK